MCSRVFVANLLFGLIGGGAVLAQNTTAARPTYFPPKVFADLKQSRYMDGKLQQAWFGSQLFDLKEPALIGRTRNDEPVYRFTLLPSFGHPVVVRVTIHQDGTATVVTRVGKGAGGYAPKGLAADRSNEINREKVDALKEAVTRAKFWQCTTEPNQQGGTDGTEWLFEGADSGRYHVVDRWEGANLRQLGLFFLEQIGQPEPEAELSHSLE